MNAFVTLLLTCAVALAHECDSPKSKDCPEFYKCCDDVCNNMWRKKGCGWSYADGIMLVSGTCVCRAVNNADINVEEFRNQMLAQHNVLRTKHHAPAMTLDSALNTKAQDWAKHLATEVHKMKHSEGGGENIARHGALPTGKQSTDLWYSEVKDYDFDNPGTSNSTGHFTQVVWKASTKLGVGIYSDEANGNVYVVANYEPVGNFYTIGKKAEAYEANVLPA